MDPVDGTNVLCIGADYGSSVVHTTRSVGKSNAFLTNFNSFVSTYPAHHVGMTYPDNASEAVKDRKYLGALSKNKTGILRSKAGRKSRGLAESLTGVLQTKATAVMLQRYEDSTK